MRHLITAALGAAVFISAFAGEIDDAKAPKAPPSLQIRHLELRPLLGGDLKLMLGTETCVECAQIANWGRDISDVVMELEKGFDKALHPLTHAEALVLANELAYNFVKLRDCEKEGEEADKDESGEATPYGPLALAWGLHESFPGSAMYAFNGPRRVLIAPLMIPVNKEQDPNGAYLFYVMDGPDGRRTGIVKTEEVLEGFRRLDRAYQEAVAKKGERPVNTPPVSTTLPPTWGVIVNGDPSKAPGGPLPYLRGQLDSGVEFKTGPSIDRFRSALEVRGNSADGSMSMGVDFLYPMKAIGASGPQVQMWVEGQSLADAANLKVRAYTTGREHFLTLTLETDKGRLDRKK